MGLCHDPGQKLVTCMQAWWWPHQGAEQDDGHSIVQDALAEDQVEQQGGHIHRRKHRQRGHRVCGRDQGTCRAGTAPVITFTC